jgi:RNA polymerase sigma-70 factor, ECF subfamily
VVSSRSAARPELGEQFDIVLAAAQAGGQWAVAALYRTLSPSVLRYLEARAGQEAEDIASEAWMDVARSLRRFSGDESAFRSWVFTIVHRRLVDHHRSRTRRREEITSDQHLGSIPASDDPARRVLDGLAGDRAVQRINELLPPDQAEVVLLRVVGGFSTEEVALITGRRPGTLRVLQHRALKRLAQALEENGSEL